jgi:hypothetical protein
VARTSHNSLTKSTNLVTILANIAGWISTVANVVNKQHELLQFLCFVTALTTTVFLIFVFFTWGNSLVITNSALQIVLLVSIVSQYASGIVVAFTAFQYFFSK